jgi:hypothetical protein
MCSPYDVAHQCRFPIKRSRRPGNRSGVIRIPTERGEYVSDDLGAAADESCWGREGAGWRRDGMGLSVRGEEDVGWGGDSSVEEGEGAYRLGAVDGGCTG